MENTAKLKVNDATYELPLIEGSEGEIGVDISTLRSQSGVITLDKGFKNTGSTKSAITFLNGEEGILRYRGYSIEELSSKSNFLEVSFLLIYGELPSKKELEDFTNPEDYEDKSEKIKNYDESVDLKEVTTDEEDFRVWEGIEEDWEDFNKKDEK